MHWFLLQIKGRTLPVETICMQTSSFATGADVSWSREVVRDVSISSVSTADIYIYIHTQHNPSIHFD